MGKKTRRKATADVSFEPHPAQDPTAEDTLVDDLLDVLDTRDADLAQSRPDEVVERKNDFPSKEKRTNKPSKARFKAREMRRLANRLAELPTNDSDEANADKIANETATEEKTIRTICDQQGLRIHEINPDGHCLFGAVADQLLLLSLLPPAEATYQTTRKAAADYIQSHSDDFLPFLVSLTDDNPDEPMTLEELEKYCHMIRSTAVWGGEPEILALSRAYNVPIHVIQGGKPSVVVHSPNAGAPRPEMSIWISYHRRLYGLGEHYNSLHPNKSPS